MRANNSEADRADAIRRPSAFPTKLTVSIHQLVEDSDEDFYKPPSPAHSRENGNPVKEESRALPVIL